ncbi:hypothetical protein HYDPIDRAFT_100314, partial [Hydnomerulius pinastri MD-312]
MSSRPLHVLKGHGSNIPALAFVPNSDILVSGGDGGCQIWDARIGVQVGQLFQHTSIRSVGASADGQWIATGGNDGSIVIWKSETREKLVEWKTGHPPLSLCFSLGARELASGHEGGQMNVWNPATGDRISGPFKLDHGYIDWVSFSPQGDRLAVSTNSVVRIVDPHSGVDVIKPITAHKAGSRRALWSSDTQQIISASQDHTIKFFDSSTGSVISTCTGHNGTVCSISLFNHGELLASVSDDSTIRFWS